MDDFGDIIPPGVKIIYASEITQNDVLCGRGGSINTNPGNERFRKLVDSKKRLYLTARFKREKRLIASKIVAEIHSLNPPGRFLTKIPDPDKKNKKKGAHALTWYEVNLERARDKTSQALREGAPIIRKEMEDERVHYVSAGDSKYGDDFDDEDDYEDLPSTNSQQDVDKRNNKDPHYNNHYSSWIPQLDTTAPWNSFRSFAANVPYFGSSNNETIEDSQHAVPPLRPPQQQIYPASANGPSSVTSTNPVISEQSPYGNNATRMKEDRFSHVPPNCANTYSNPMMDYSNSNNHMQGYWRPNAASDHPSMPPPSQQQYHQQQQYKEKYYGEYPTSMTSTPSGVLVVPAVTPESTKYQRTNGSQYSMPYYSTAPSNPYPRQQIMPGEKGDSIRTLDSGLIQCRQSWENEIDTNTPLFDSDVEMQDIKDNVETSEQRDENAEKSSPWSNLESWFGCGLNNNSFDFISHAHTLCSGGFDNDSVDSPLGGPSLCNVFNEIEQLPPYYDDSGRYDIPETQPPLAMRNEEIEVQLGRRRSSAYSPLTLEQSDRSIMSDFGSDMFKSDKSLRMMDFAIPPSPINSLKSKSSDNEPLYDFAQVWKSSRDQ